MSRATLVIILTVQAFPLTLWISIWRVSLNLCFAVALCFRLSKSSISPYGYSLLDKQKSRHASRISPQALTPAPMNSPDKDDAPCNEDMRVRASVVVPVQNRESFIGPLLESLFAQWRPDLELILIDDASDDATFSRAMEILELYPAISSITVRLNHVHGMQAVEVLRTISRGEIIIHADSDDIAFPNRIDRILQCFVEDADCRLVTTNAVLLSPEGLLFGLYDTRQPDIVLRSLHDAGQDAWTARRLGATMAYHRDVLDKFPPIDTERCPYGLDLILPTRALLIGNHHYLAKPLVGWRQHHANTHRLVGAHASDPSQSEKYKALEMMALAQNIRDVEVMVPQYPNGSLDLLLSDMRANFLAVFDAWCLLRTRATQTKKNNNDVKGSSYISPISPILSIRGGEKIRFSRSDARSKLVASAAGCHQPEEWGLWTQRVALLNVRINLDKGAHGRLDLLLYASHLINEVRFEISINGIGWTQGVLVGGEFGGVEVDFQTAKPASIIGIIIVTHDTIVPKEIYETVDDRQIGVGLVSMTITELPRTGP